MKIDFNTVITDLRGAPIPVSKTGVLDLKAVATNALLSAHPEDDHLPGEEKVKRFMLALTIEQATAPVDLKVEQVAMLKSLVARMYAPLVVGRVFEILDA